MFGLLWQAGVWAANRPGDLVQGDNYAELKLEFLNSEGDLLDSDSMTTVHVDSSTNYQPFSLKRLAPAGAAGARIVVAYVQVSNATGSVVFDDAALTRLTAADPRVVLNPGFEDGELTSLPNWPSFFASNNIVHETDLTHIYSGASAVRMSGTSLSASNTSGLFQDFPAEPGEMLQVGAWGKNRDDDPLSGSNSALLKLEFYDGEGALLLTQEEPVLNAGSGSAW